MTQNNNDKAEQSHLQSLENLSQTKESVKIDSSVINSNVSKSFILDTSEKRKKQKFQLPLHDIHFSYGVLADEKSRGASL
jgi:hypothetical protein